MAPVTTIEHLAESELVRAGEVLRSISDAFDARIVGQERLRTAMLVTLLAEGHLLVESVPGLAKTLASSTLAQAVRADFARIQCTPDLLPSDIIGTQVYDPRHHLFETQLGPVHANIVLLDEINRASAKTQSAMLEAMQERQTSIAGQVHPLPRPFMVLATQNPIEQEGTYVLPEAQMDRFLLKEVLDYPSAEEEVSVLDRVGDGTFTQSPSTGGVVGPAEVLQLQSLAARVYVDPAVKRYIVDLVHATRHASTRHRSRPRRLRRDRGQPAGVDRVLLGRACAGRAARPGLRRAGGRPGAAAQRAAPPPAPDLRGAGRPGAARDPHRRRLRRRPDSLTPERTDPWPTTSPGSGRGCRCTRTAG